MGIIGLSGKDLMEAVNLMLGKEMGRIAYFMFGDIRVFKQGISIDARIISAQILEVGFDYPAVIQRGLLVHLLSCDAVNIPSGSFAVRRMLRIR